MDIREFSPIFRRSGTIGIICELVGYGCVLACSLLLSDLLAREGQTQAFRTFLYRCVIDRRVSVGTPGEMQGKLGGDANTLAAFFQNTLPKAISGAVVILCATALLCMENLLLGSIFFFLNLIQLLPIFLYENWARQIYEQTHSDEEAYCNWMLEGYRGIRTLKAYGMERWFMARYRQLNRAIVDSGKRAEKTGTVENIVFNAVDSLLNYGSYLVVGLFILCGKAELSRAPYLIVLAIFVLAALPLACTACMAGIRTRLKKEASEYSEDRKQLEQELFDARDFAKSYSLHGFFVSHLEKRFRAFLQKTGQAQCRVDALAEALDFLSGQGSRLCIVLVGTFLAARGKMELGMLLTGFLMLPSLTQCFAYVRGWITEKHDEAKYGIASPCFTVNLKTAKV